MESPQKSQPLDLMWIDANLKEDAIIQGYTVIDPSTVIATHMSELVKKYAEEFITKDEVKKLMDRLEEEYPAAIEEAKKVPSSVIRSVLQALLHEGIQSLRQSQILLQACKMMWQLSWSK